MTVSTVTVPSTPKQCIKDSVAGRIGGEAPPPFWLIVNAAKRRRID
jgi:hypothetical protein